MNLDQDSLDCKAAVLTLKHAAQYLSWSCSLDYEAIQILIDLYQDLRKEYGIVWPD